MHSICSIRILLFSVPVNWAPTPKLVYVFITYNLVSTVIYTAINVPYSALNALMTQDPYERSVLSIFRNLLATAGTLLINTFTLPMVEFLETMHLHGQKHSLF